MTLRRWINLEQNQDIKQLIAKKRLRQYEIANQLHVSEFTLSRWLNRELDQNHKQKILKAIDEVSEKLGM